MEALLHAIGTLLHTIEALLTALVFVFILGFILDILGLSTYVADTVTMVTVEGMMLLGFRCHAM